MIEFFAEKAECCLKWQPVGSRYKGRTYSYLQLIFGNFDANLLVSFLLSFRCLEQNGWDVKKAGGVFTSLQVIENDMVMKLRNL